jgi:hypothetical protein
MRPGRHLRNAGSTGWVFAWRGQCDSANTICAKTFTPHITAPMPAPNVPEVEVFGNGIHGHLVSYNRYCAFLLPFLTSSPRKFQFTRIRRYIVSILFFALVKKWRTHYRTTFRQTLLLPFSLVTTCHYAKRFITFSLSITLVMNRIECGEAHKCLS